MSYAIVVYDVEADRTQKPRKLLRKYLTHVQDSVFEGEVTKGELDEIRDDLESMVKPSESIMVYEVSTEEYVDRSVFGEDPMDDTQFI